MADTKVTALTELSVVADADLLYAVDDPAGSPVSKKVTASTLRQTIHPERIAASFEAMRIRDSAGVKAVPGVPAGVITGVSGTPAAETTALVITQESDISGFSGVTGTGTKYDPYVINLKKWDTLSGPPSYLLDWNDPDADYYIKLTNCYFNLVAANGYCVRVNIAARDLDQCELTLENCDLRTTTNPSGHIYITSGIVNADKCHFQACYAYSCTIAGGLSAKLIITDSIADSLAGNWSGGAGWVRPDGDDGSIVEMYRCTLDLQYTNLVAGPFSVGEIILEQILGENAAELMLLGPTAKDIINFEMRNCSWTADTAATRYIIRCEQSGYHTIRKGLIENCYFESMRSAGSVRMITIGSNSPADQQPNGVTVRGCYFKKDTTQQAAGNEVLEFYGARNCVIEDCWVEGGGEDAYEFHTCKGGNVVRNSGGHNIGGQLVDIYLSHAEGGGFIVENLYGECGIAGHAEGQAVVLTDVTDVVVKGVFVDNTAGITTPALIEVDYAGAKIPDRIKVYGPLSQDENCAGGEQLAVHASAGSDIAGRWFEDGGFVSYGSPDILPPV